jgi:hypothetical protein
MADRFGTVDHGPLVKSPTAEKAGPFAGTRKHIAQPKNGFHPPGRQPASICRYSVRDFRVAPLIEVLAGGVSPQGDTDARVPLQELSRAVGIVFEKKVFDRMAFVL